MSVGLHSADYLFHERHRRFRALDSLWPMRPLFSADSMPQRVRPGGLVSVSPTLVEFGITQDPRKECLVRRENNLAGQTRDTSRTSRAAEPVRNPESGRALSDVCPVSVRGLSAVA